MSRLARGTTERYPESLVEINPADADQFGVEDGQMVKVTSRRGNVTAKAAPDKAARRRARSS